MISVWDANRLVTQRYSDTGAAAEADELTDAAEEFGSAWGSPVGSHERLHAACDGIRSMHLAWAGECEPRLVTGHASGSMAWWGAAENVPQ